MPSYRSQPQRSCYPNWKNRKAKRPDSWESNRAVTSTVPLAPKQKQSRTRAMKASWNRLSQGDIVHYKC